MATTKSVNKEATKSTKANTKPAAPKKAETKAETKAEPKKENAKKKSAPLVQQMTNVEMQKLFNENGCATYTKASEKSEVVYNTFGTKSRVLQQKRAYQLLLTNGHKKEKEQIVDCTNDDTARFIKWYNKLAKADQAKVSGFDGLTTTKLSDSEMPRERTVKLTDYELLVRFIQYMASFDENKVAVAAK